MKAAREGGAQQIEGQQHHQRNTGRKGAALDAAPLLPAACLPRRQGGAASAPGECCWLLTRWWRVRCKQPLEAAQAQLLSLKLLR